MPTGEFVPVAVMKLYVSGSGKIEQRCIIDSGAQTVLVDLNVLRDFSLQPAVTFPFVTGWVRYCDQCILQFCAYITVPLLCICCSIL